MNLVENYINNVMEKERQWGLSPSTLEILLQEFHKGRKFPIIDVPLYIEN